MIWESHLVISRNFLMPFDTSSKVKIFAFFWVTYICYLNLSDSNSRHKYPYSIWFYKCLSKQRFSRPGEIPKLKLFILLFLLGFLVGCANAMKMRWWWCKMRRWMEEIVVYTTLTKAWPLFVASMHFRKPSFPLEKCGNSNVFLVL